jgi:CheY-like chemotaxis protein
MNQIELLCVIDDDDVYQFTVKKMVQKAGVANKIISFRDGEKAILFFEEIIQKSNKDEFPDVILLDINMPIMDGWEFIENYLLLKPKIGKKILIYMVSSSVHEADVVKANSISEISDYIVKPITRENMFEIVKKLQETVE